MNVVADRMPGRAIIVSAIGQSNNTPFNYEYNSKYRYENQFNWVSKSWIPEFQITWWRAHPVRRSRTWTSCSGFLKPLLLCKLLCSLKHALTCPTLPYHTLSCCSVPWSCPPRPAHRFMRSCVRVPLWLRRRRKWQEGVISRNFQIFLMKKWWCCGSRCTPSPQHDIL